MPSLFPMTARTTALITVSSLLAAGSSHAFLINDFDTDLGGLAPVYAPAQISPSPPIPPDIPAEDASNTLNPLRTTTGVELPGVNPASGSFNPGGSHFVEVTNFYEPFPSNFLTVIGDRVSWNNSPSGGFESGAGTTVMVYFDDPLATLSDGSGDPAYLNGDAFYFQPTLMDDTNSFNVNGGGFGVRFNTDHWEIVADGDSRGFDGADPSASVVSISTPGWYTMTTLWFDDGTGNVDQWNGVRDQDGNLVLFEVFQNVEALADVGALGVAAIGNGGVAAFSGFGALGIDNAGTVNITQGLSLVPEPGSVGLILSIATACFVLLRRRA